MPDINELAEKKLKSRVRKIKKVNKSDEEKEKFFVQLGASVEIFFPNKKPEELSDSLIYGQLLVKLLMQNILMKNLKMNSLFKCQYLKKI